MNNYPDWIPKYVELKSQLLCDLTESAIALECNIRRETIYRYFKTNPRKKLDIERIIYKNKQKQTNIIGSLSFDALVKKLQSKKVSDKCIQMGLVVSGDYTEKTDNVNKYDRLEKDQLDSAIENIILRAKNVRNKSNSE